MSNIDFQKITYRFVGDDVTKEHLVKSEDIGKMIIAMIKLHHTPGINPYNGGTCAKLEYLCLHKPSLSMAYWWTSPDLKSDNGARLYNFRDDQVIYRSAKLHAEHLEECFLSNNVANAASVGPVKVLSHTHVIGPYMDPAFEKYFDISDDYLEVDMCDEQR